VRADALARVALRRQSLSTPGETRSAEEAAITLAEFARRTRRFLLWIEGADVASMRAAVRLAEVSSKRNRQKDQQWSSVTIHAASSPGHQAIRRVKMTDGWLGTSLAEVAEHADCIITLGDRLHQRMPLVGERFLSESSVSSTHPGAPRERETEATGNALKSQRWIHLTVAVTRQAAPQPELAEEARADPTPRCTIAETPGWTDNRLVWSAFTREWLSEIGERENGDNEDTACLPQPASSDAWSGSHPVTHSRSNQLSCSEAWYAALTRLHRGVTERLDDVASLSVSDQIGMASEVESPSGESSLISILLRAKNIAFVWESDEFCGELGELIVRRLQALAEKLSASRRCSLLPLASEVGKVTAGETLRWLTGCSSTASLAAGSFVGDPRLEHRTPEQLQADFDGMLLLHHRGPEIAIRWGTDLPALLASISTASSPQRSSESRLLEPLSNGEILPLAVAGLDTPGHFFRGDGVNVCLAGAEPAAMVGADRQGDASSRPSELPWQSAEQLLVNVADNILNPAPERLDAS
jgi:hypothetical protein